MNFLNNILQENSIVIEITKVAVVALATLVIYKLITFRESRRQKRALKFAYTDELTGKGNRYLLYQELDKLIANNENIAVGFMDIDGFKQINDILGHETGDEVLKYVSSKFDEALPKNAKAYRLGGDEFAIVISKVNSKDEVISILDGLKESMKKPFVIDNDSITVEYSLGVVLSLDVKYSRKELINYADNAMYYVKEHGGNGYYFHNESLKAMQDNNIKMEKDLNKAYENNEFGINLQPRINVNDTSKICFEALLNWNHPVLGNLDAAYFINQAETMGLTIKLDEYVIEKVCEKIIEFRDKGFENIQIAVNIANKNIYKRDFIDNICNIISSYNLPSNSLQIEMSGKLELSKIELYKLAFEKLKSLGISIIINSFEIRQEELELFKELPIDEIKLSASTLSSKNINENVFYDLVRLAKDLDYKVIVGRIDDDQKLVKSISSGADKIQGNFLFKKMDEKFAEELLQSYGAYRLRIDDIILNAKK